MIQDPLRAGKLGGWLVPSPPPARADPLGLTEAWSTGFDRDGCWGRHINTTFSASSGVAPEDAVLLLDEVSTQDDVLPPLCIFSAHSVEESWGSRAIGSAEPQHTLSAGSLLWAATQGCPTVSFDVFKY